MLLLDASDDVNSLDPNGKRLGDLIAPISNSAFNSWKKLEVILELYIPFRSGRNGRKISYRYANRYETTPLLHLGLNFGVFQSVWAFRPVCFLGDFFFLSPLDFSDLSASSSCQPALTPAVNRPLQPLVSNPQPLTPAVGGPASLSALSSLPPHFSKAANFPHISDQLIKKIY